MSLASMQGGEGIPSLISEVQDPSAGSKRDFSFQMLAQMSAQYPDAGAALLEQAKANQISDAAWRKIATGLAGDQYVLGDPPPEGTGAGSLPGLKTYHINNGNQNFYSLPLDGSAPIDPRLNLINQLLASTSNPNAIAALQTAQATLNALKK